MGSQEGSQRRSLNKFPVKCHPDSTEGEGGGHPYWELGTQNRIGGASQRLGLKYHKRRRRRRLPIMGDRSA